MRRESPSSFCGTSEIHRQFRPDTDKIVGRKFGAVAKAIEPRNTAAHVAAAGKVSHRHAERIIAGEFEPNGGMIAWVILEMTKVG